MGCGCCCNCFGSKTQDEDMYEDAERDEKEEEEDLYHESKFNGDLTGIDDDDLPPPVDELPPNLPDVVVTQSKFSQTEDSSRKTSVKKMFKKIKKPLSKVTFASSAKSSEKHSLIETPIGSHDSGYGTTMTTLHRSDSMESFMSALSTVTTANVEEFGEEVPPSRLQVFIQYDQRRWLLSIGVKQGECLLNLSNQTMFWQVHMTLLPFKKHRFKTRYKSSSTPIFNQSFEVDNISVQALAQLAIRYRVYGRTGRTGRKKLAGETEIELSEIMEMPDRILRDWRIMKRKKDKKQFKEEDSNYYNEESHFEYEG